ncbi:MAG: metal-dependent hydrolase [Verrucomicrobia bacterium]|nr:MAG: metal-dependent hydrolase [Verrucomicrobiota bacterium]
MKITYLSHSCILIETGEHRLLVDPFLTGNPLATVDAASVDCDYIAITHGHDDHVGDAGDIARRTGATIIANYEIATYFGSQGLKAHGMYHGGKWQFPFGTAKMVLAHHGSGYSGGNEGPLRYMGSPAGFVFTIEGKNIYHAGDTCVFLEMELIGRMHPLEAAFLPIGDNFTMGIDEATEAVKLLKPRKVVPIHYNTWELIAVDPQAFAARAREAGAEPVVLAPGASLEL